MREFIFTGDPTTYYWDEKPIPGNVYPENYFGTKNKIPFKPLNYSCKGENEAWIDDPQDWKEIFSNKNIEKINFETLNKLVINWANDKNLLKPENHLKQFAKMVSEVGELGDALIKDQKEEVIDSIGDVQVCLIILCEQLGLNPTECLESAYNVIKNRTGRNHNGTFIKD